MSRYYFTDAREHDGFFSKIRVEGTTAQKRTEFKRSDGTLEKSKSNDLTGSLIPGTVRSYRAQKDQDTGHWLVDATEEQMSEWAKEIGAKDSKGNFIEKVRFADSTDAFLTSSHCKVVINDKFMPNDAITEDKVRLAVLRGRRDFDFGDNDLSEYDKTFNVIYKANKLGVKVGNTKANDINEKMKFYTALAQCSTERKVQMLERLKIPIEGIPEDAVMNETLDMKYNEEGSIKVGRKNDEMKTNREVIDFMMDLESEQLELLFYIHKAHRFKIFTWNSTYNYYEYNGYKLGRKLDEVEQYLLRSENASTLHSMINEIKNREKTVETEITKGRGKK